MKPAEVKSIVNGLEKSPKGGGSPIKGSPSGAGSVSSASSHVSEFHPCGFAGKGGKKK